jgi:hypothetical protein
MLQKTQRLALILPIKKAPAGNADTMFTLLLKGVY